MYQKTVLSILVCVILQAVVLPLCGGIQVEKWHKLEEYHIIYIEPNYQYNWHEASNECSRKNMSLVIIDGSEKSEAITQLLRDILGKSRNLWLGGNDLGDEGDFVWDSTGKHFEFTNWDRRPDNYRGGEDCVHIHANSNYKWNDGNCAQKMGFLCEQSAGGGIATKLFQYIIKS